jgi:taurine dioxygenase
MAVLAAKTQQAFKVQSFGAPLGGEIVDIDLSQPLDDADFVSVRRAFLDNLVIVFRNQHFTPSNTSLSVGALARCRYTCCINFI